MKEQDYKFIVRGLGMAISSTARTLETIANNLSNFGFEIKKLPEYQQAIDAINAYEKSTVAEVNRLLKSRKGKSR